jgi:ATP phosphoribosyltransferase
MQPAVFRLLAEAGIELGHSAREYRPTVSLPGWSAKIQKPQNIVEMLHAGTTDAGFAGHDWVMELDADVVEALDLGLDPVRLVAAAPECVLEDGRLPARPLVVASEYERLASLWIAKRGQGDRFVRSYGATEVFPPEDADVVFDITATGSTLAANGLKVVDEAGASSTRLYASRRAWADPAARQAVEGLALALRSVLEARGRVMLECNVPTDALERVVAILPCMREPTVSRLHGGAGFAVKVVVPRPEVAGLIPRIREAHGSDIVVTEIRQVVP